MTVVPLTTLKSHESKEELAKWWGLGPGASILSTKLKHNDVASLKDLILEKAQDVLEELEGSEASVNRMYHRPQQSRPQNNSGYQSRAPQNSRQTYRRDQRSGGATSRHRTPSPAKVPKNPDNYCCLCLKDPQRKHNASTHFLRECTQQSSAHPFWATPYRSKPW